MILGSTDREQGQRSETEARVVSSFMSSDPETQPEVGFSQKPAHSSQVFNNAQDKSSGRKKDKLSYRCDGSSSSLFLVAFLVFLMCGLDGCVRIPF